MSAIEKIITDLELVKASIEWDSPLDYQIMIDEAIHTIRELQIKSADGCDGCAFIEINEWEMPCSKCKRNCKDYWRAKKIKEK